MPAMNGLISLNVFGENRYQSIWAMSVFEFERYFVRRLRHRLSAPISPASPISYTRVYFGMPFSALTINIPHDTAVINTLSNVLQMAHMLGLDTTRPRIPIYAMDEVNDYPEKRTVQVLGVEYTADDIDWGVAYYIRMNQPIKKLPNHRELAQVRSMGMGVVQLPSVNEMILAPGATYYELVKAAILLGLDIDHVYTRDNNNPITSFPGNPRGSHAEFIERHIRAGTFGIEIQHSYNRNRPMQYNNVMVRGPIVWDTVVQSSSQLAERQYTPNSLPTPLAILNASPKTALVTPKTPDLGEVAPSCAVILADFKEPFVGFGNKLKRACTSFSKACTNLEAIREDLKRAMGRIRPEIKEFMRIPPETVLAYFYKQWKEHPLPSRFFLFQAEAMTARYMDQEGVGPGVIRSIIQRLLDELVLFQVFLPSTDEPVERCLLNPKFVAKPETGLSLKTEKDYESFYTFIGHLLTFVVLNPSAGMRQKLSYSILANMLYKPEEITEDDYVSYALMDYPTEFQTYANLMRNPDWIEASDITFNSLYPLRETDEAVTKDNFRTYLRELCRYRYTKQVPGRWEGFIKGAGTLRKLLRNRKMTIPTLDRIVTSITVTKEVVRDLIKIIEAQIVSERGRESDNIPMLEGMVWILRDEGKHFPEGILEQPPNFLEFVEKLLMFWTGLRRFIPESSYRMTVIKAEHTDAGRRLKRRLGRDLTKEEEEQILPESHTCFTRIDIPSVYAGDKEKLYRKLAQSVYLVEAGVGNYGGGKSKRVTRARVKS